MKCTECGFEAAIKEFRYNYNPRIDASVALRQCPECHAVITVDEQKQEVIGRMHPGDDPWGKSAGIENLAVQ